MNHDLSDYYPLENIATIDSPALIIYEEKVIHNVRTAISMVDNISLLRPHVKTHKSKDVSRLMLKEGIYKFKCATIAEAEMLGMIKAPDILFAYPLTGPKLERFMKLVKTYPESKFSCLIDNYEAATRIGTIAVKCDVQIEVFLDLNIGMNRTGIQPGKKAIELYEKCDQTKGLRIAGLHAYDGHISNLGNAENVILCNIAFEQVTEMQLELQKKGFENIILIAGGSPTFPIHAKRKNVECSPGTFIFWDGNYQSCCPDQNFLPAALVISRIISIPDHTTLCLDLGHKSIASENTLGKRISYYNAPELIFIAHSEEHLIVKAPLNHSYQIGDVLYGLPWHICPTVALYDNAYLVSKTQKVSILKIEARVKNINI